MFAGGFGRGAELQHVSLAEARRGDNFDHIRLPLRDGAGLVEQDGRQGAGAFEGFAAAEEDAGFGAASAADHDGGRRRQPEGAGAGDHEHGDHIENGLRQVSAAEGQPADQA